MKKMLTIIAAAGIIGLIGSQFASAGPYGRGQGHGYGYGCGNYAGSWSGTTEEGVKQRAEFYTETEEARKNLAIKNAELRALMLQDNPDEKKVASVTAEIYDLRTSLEKKAAKKGITPGGYFGHHMDWNDGWGRGRHMMGW